MISIQGDMTPSLKFKEMGLGPLEGQHALGPCLELGNFLFWSQICHKLPNDLEWTRQ